MQLSMKIKLGLQGGKTSPPTRSPDSFKTTCQEILHENTSTSAMDGSRGSGDQILPVIDDNIYALPGHLDSISLTSLVVPRPSQNSSYSMLRELFGTDHARETSVNAVRVRRTMFYVCPVNDVVQGMTINPGNTTGVNLIQSVYLRNLLEFS